MEEGICMKFKAKIKDYQLVIKAKTSFGENIDEKELEKFSSIAYLRGFFKANLIKKNQIEYTAPIGISLHERLRKTITRKDFYFVMEHIILAMEKIQNNGLDSQNLIMDIQNIYINENTKELHFLYVPVKVHKTQNNVRELIETVIYSVKPAQENDMDYISRFTYFLQNLKSLDLQKIEQYIMKEDRDVVNTLKKNSGQSGFITNKQKEFMEHYDNDDEDKTSLLDHDDELTGLLQEEETEETTLLTDDEETGLLYEDETHYPTLVRTLTQERIPVDKQVFRLGKERSYVDYFVNNSAVSRSHADIITRGSCYYVNDLRGSWTVKKADHTYINGKMLPVKQEIEIHDGDKLKLGNEEFVFYE